MHTVTNTPMRQKAFGQQKQITKEKKENGQSRSASITLDESDDQPERQHQLVRSHLEDSHASCGRCHHRPRPDIAQLKIRNGTNVMKQPSPSWTMRRRRRAKGRGKRGRKQRPYFRTEETRKMMLSLEVPKREPRVRGTTRQAGEIA